MNAKLYCSLMGVGAVLASSVGLGFGASYSETVLTAGPIAYWRFSDVRPVATNSGSLGAAANGSYFGDAKPGTEAPRSPQFPGFEANNTALQLDGAGDFVGTVAGLMNS